MPAPADGRAQRRGYLDWLRGVAVLIMIEAHVLDSWTGGVARDTRAFQVATLIGGLGAPLFLFLAGLAVPLAGSARSLRAGRNGAATSLVRRGLQIFGLALLFRLQAWILGWSSPRDLLKVDILNIMGPSIAAAGVLWGASSRPRARALAFGAAAVLIALATPLVLSAPLDRIPDPLEAYLRPAGNLANFTFFPWSAFLFAGAVAGVVLDRAPRTHEARVNTWLFCAGVCTSLTALASSWLPTPYPSSSFWTSSPAYFFIRAGILTTLIGVAFAWESRPGGLSSASPLRQLGRTSLFIYWIHVEMVYGLISRPLHKALTLPEALTAFVLFAVFMLLCSLAKDRAMPAFRRRFSGDVGLTRGVSG